MKENNIDFLKWMYEKAEGFKVKGNFVSILSSVALWSFEELANDEILFSFLLQGTIEGINKESYFGNGQIEIIQHRWGIQIKDYSTDNHEKKVFRFENNKDYKKAALFYIYEQEKNNEKEYS